MTAEVAHTAVLSVGTTGGLQVQCRGVPVGATLRPTGLILISAGCTSISLGVTAIPASVVVYPRGLTTMSWVEMEIPVAPWEKKHGLRKVFQVCQRLMCSPGCTQHTCQNPVTRRGQYPGHACPIKDMSNEQNVMQALCD